MKDYPSLVDTFQTFHSYHRGELDDCSGEGTQRILWNNGFCETIHMIDTNEYLA